MNHMFGVRVGAKKVPTAVARQIEAVAKFQGVKWVQIYEPFQYKSWFECRAYGVERAIERAVYDALAAAGVPDRFYGGAS